MKYFMKVRLLIKLFSFSSQDWQLMAQEIRLDLNALTNSVCNLSKLHCHQCHWCNSDNVCLVQICHIGCRFALIVHLGKSKESLRHRGHSCGSISTADASYNSHWQFILTANCIEKTTIKKKEARNWKSLRQRK